MYVRDTLVMANYDEKKYLYKIITDALDDSCDEATYENHEVNVREAY